MKLSTVQTGDSPRVWMGDADRGTWGVEGDNYFPGSDHQAQSLASGIKQGDVAGATEDGVTLVQGKSLQSLLTAEWASPQPDTVASYANWPVEDGSAGSVPAG